MLCDYCLEPLFDKNNTYSIPLDQQFQKWSGSFCSAQCRLSGNRHVESNDRSRWGWEKREGWIRQLDRVFVEYAPDPWQLQRWNPENGMKRAQWLPESVITNGKVEKR